MFPKSPSVPTRLLPGLSLSLSLSLAFLRGASSPASAQEPYRPAVPGALLAAETLKRQVPDHSFERLVEISGKGGNPIPRAWTVISHDPHSPSGLLEFVVRGRKVEPRGEANTFYPRVPPDGFFVLSRVTVDSEQAFRIADKEAGLAKVGFDSLDFRLRAREFSDDALWTVRLHNAEDEIVGNVDLSASSGKVMRTVWYYRDPASRGLRIVDSAWPGTPKIPTDPDPGLLDPSIPSPGAPAPQPVPAVPNPDTVPGGGPFVDPAPSPEPLPVPVPGAIPSPEPLPVPVPGEEPRPVPVPVPPASIPAAPKPFRPGATGPAAPVPPSPSPGFR